MTRIFQDFGAAVALVFVPTFGPRFLVICALPMTYLLLYLGAVVPIALGRRNDISYGIYMYGYPVQQSLRYFHFSSQLLFIAASIGATIPLAVASWFFIERPAMRWRSARPRSARGAAATANLPVRDAAESRTSPTVRGYLSRQASTGPGRL